VKTYKEGVGHFLKFVRFHMGDGSKVNFWHGVGINH
jgi:hypothetical protein